MQYTAQIHVPLWYEPLNQNKMVIDEDDGESECIDFVIVLKVHLRHYMFILWMTPTPIFPKLNKRLFQSYAPL